MWNWDRMPPASTVPKPGYRFSEAEHRKAAEHVRDNHPQIFEWVQHHPDGLPDNPAMHKALTKALEEILPGYLGFDQIYAWHMVMTLANPPTIEQIKAAEERLERHRRFRQKRGDGDNLHYLQMSLAEDVRRGNLSMANYALLRCTAEQLLDTPTNGDDLLYEDDVRTLAADGILFTKHHQISASQAHAIMRKILDDEVIIKALRNGIEEAKINPLGNMPMDGVHPVDPAVQLVKERAIRPVLGELPPGNVALRFVAMAYGYIASHI